MSCSASSDCTVSIVCDLPAFQPVMSRPARYLLISSKVFSVPGGICLASHGMHAVTPMTMCRVSVLTEALQGKSRWLRKAPLELTHPDRAVFEGQQTVLLFAAGSAAKEQWFVALSAAACADGGAGRSVHALYNSFCDYVREHALVAYPEVSLFRHTYTYQVQVPRACFLAHDHRCAAGMLILASFVTAIGSSLQRAACRPMIRTCSMMA